MHQKRCCRRAKWCARRRRLIWAVATAFWSSAWSVIYDRHAAYAAGLKKGDITVMIHTGSRDVGFYVGRRWMDLAKQQWPQGLKHPQHGLYGLSGALAQDYLQAMGVAARYAWFNRMARWPSWCASLRWRAPPDASN